MSSIEALQPISILLDGKNYVPWARQMSLYLKGENLWRYISGDQIVCSQAPQEITPEELEQKGVWQAKNATTLLCMANSAIPSISLQILRFGTAKEAWDSLKERYCPATFVDRFVLELQLRNIRQKKGQPVSDVYYELSAMWENLEMLEPKFSDGESQTAFRKYCDEGRLIQFLMALDDDFEPIRARILFRIPPPTLESALLKILDAETRKRGVMEAARKSFPETRNPGARGRGPKMGRK